MFGAHQWLLSHQGFSTFQPSDPFIILSCSYMMLSSVHRPLIAHSLHLLTHTPFCYILNLIKILGKVPSAQAVSWSEWGTDQLHLFLAGSSDLSDHIQVYHLLNNCLPEVT
ncbi:UNVERIFIED_CONTAM: hypothetical protein K2H54_060195 [Gekko kuhli]